MAKQDGSFYSRSRLVVILCIMTLNALLSLANILQHRYPIGLVAVLFLVPPLLRELDVKSGRPLRGVDSFQWSCLLAGLLFLFILPLVTL
jgi:hypothetical protein